MDYGTLINPPNPSTNPNEGTQLSPEEYYQRTGIIPVGKPPKILPRSALEDFFVKKGLPSYIAQGIGDATYMESGAPGGGYNTTAVNPKSGATGVFQDLGPRKNRLLSQPNWQTGDTQLENAWGELQGPEKTTLEKLKTAKTREEAAQIWRDSFERPGSGGYGSIIGSSKWNVDPHAILTEQSRSDTSVVGMSPAEYLALTPDVEDTGTNKAKKLSLEKSINAGDMIEDIPSLDVKNGKVYDQDGRHRAMLAQQQGIDLIPVALHGITGNALPTKIAGMKGNEVPVEWKPWPTVKPDLESRYAWQAGTPENAAFAARNRALFGEGVMNVVGQGARLAEKILPESVNTAINRVIAPGRTGNIDQIEQERLAEQEQEPNVLGLRTAGQVAAELPLAMVGGTSIPGLMASGAAAGALEPVAGPNLLEGTIEHALGGGITGGALGYIGKAIPEVIDLGKRILPKVEQQAKAAIEKAFSQGAKGGGPSSADVVNALGEARTLGKPVNLVDVGSEPVRQLAKRAGSAPGPARELATQSVQNRSRAFVGDDTATGARITNDINKNITTATAKQTVADTIKARRANAAPLWEKAMAGGSTAPLRTMFETAFNEASKTTKVAAANLAKAKQELTNALAKKPTAGNVYSRSAANRETRFAEDKVKEAEKELTAAAAKQDSVLQFLHKAQSDGTLNVPGAVWSPRIQQFLDNPRIKGGINHGWEIERDNALYENRPLDAREYAIVGTNPDGTPKVGTVPSMKLLAVAKEGLDKMLEGMRDPLTGQLTKEGRAVNGVRKAFLEEIDRLNPDYAAARQQWSGDTSSIEAVRYGQKMFDRNLSPEEIRDHWNDLSDNEKQFVKIGAADRLRSDLDNTVLNGDPSKAILNTPSKLKKLRTIMGKDTEPLTKAIEYEHLMERTNKMFPRSAIGQGGEGNMEENYMVGANMLRGVRHLAHADVAGALSSFLYAGRNILRRNNPELNLAIMRILHDPSVTVQSSTAPGVRLLSSLNLPKTNATLMKGEIAKAATQRMLPYLNVGAASQQPDSAPNP